jgi:Family of unknown function (DUF5880)
MSESNCASKDNDVSQSPVPLLQGLPTAVAHLPSTTIRATGSTIGGADSIATVLKSAGPIVRCVLLQHMRPSGRDVHPHLDASVVLDLDTKPSTKTTAATTFPPEEDATDLTELPIHPPKCREVLTELIQELNVDTTPGLNGVQNILGGNFTFIGQYPDEGIVLMARADQFADLDDVDELSIRELKAIIQDNLDVIDVNPATMLDRSDLVQAVKEAQLPINPHVLQPPFDDFAVRGDILLMRVADNPDDNDDDDDDNEHDPVLAMNKAISEFTSTTAIPNDEFFLDYTKEEYILFASRTDIVPLHTEDDTDEYDDEEDREEVDDDEYEKGGEGDDDDDDEYTGDNLLDEEEDKRVLLNLILGEVIKSFRHENGRGPDSEELLELRSQVAEKLNLPLPPPASPVADTRKRKNVNDGNNLQSDETNCNSPSSKKVKFTPDVVAKSDQNDERYACYQNGTDNHFEQDHDDDRKAAAVVESPDSQERLEIETSKKDNDVDS